MNVVKSLSRRTLFWVLFFSLILWLVIDAAVYVAVNLLSLKLSVLGADAGAADYRDLVLQMQRWLEGISAYYIPVSIALALIFSLLLWLCLRLSFSGALKKTGAPEAERVRPTAPARKPAAAPADTAAETLQRERLYLHLFSLLQREGRLMDFLAEDIEEYSDENIGAAVRSIHETCRKIVDKYIVPQSILAEEEESEITIPPGFDPNAVKLTGNVTGDPPFKGILRHKGWKAGRIDMPTLSGDLDPSIIAPAEVEIL